MTTFFDRFIVTWASGGSVSAPTDANAVQGFEYLGQTPPAAELHNQLFQWLDQKDTWLYNQLFDAAAESGLTLSAGDTTTLKQLFDLKQQGLKFTPVQQGGGNNQLGNKIYLGWTSGGFLGMTVDTTDQGYLATQAWVTTAIAVETTARTAAVAAETSARSTAVANEATARYQADTYVQGLLTQEVTRAENAEGVTNTNLSNLSSTVGGIYTTVNNHQASIVAIQNYINNGLQATLTDIYARIGVVYAGEHL